MSRYEIKSYYQGVERDHARTGRQAAQDWVWPYAYDEDDLRRMHTHPGFDPDTRQYCFLNGEMVGCQFFTVMPEEEGQRPTATLDFPRMLPGHEAAAPLMMEKVFSTMREKGVRRVVGRVTDMAPGDVRLAEQTGFDIYDWGYKVYYRYDLARGPLSTPMEKVELVDPEKDLDACAALASHWYQRPPETCRAILQEWEDAGVLITHHGIKEDGEWVAACMAALNDIRSSTAAVFYIYSPDEIYLRPMLAKVIEACIQAGSRDVIADLIYEHRQYETFYQALGYQKAAEWARVEMLLE